VGAVRVRLLVPAMLLAMFAFVACGGASSDPLDQIEGNGPAAMGEQERERIRQLAERYVEALNDGDDERLRELAHSDLDDTEAQRVLEYQARGWELLQVEISPVEGDRDGAIAALFVRDEDGAEMNRVIHVRQDNGEWRIYQLH
jgi:hypothetical protein